MVELRNDRIRFSFENVWPGAHVDIGFQRTLRIPDDGKAYALPPGLGFFPLRHVDDAEGAAETWKQRGGVMLPMYQADAMWIYFSGSYINGRNTEYPCAIKIATGKINAVTGDLWRNGLNSTPQDYVVVPTQPWLDGYCVSEGHIRQFVAMPLGQGYTAEEQITGEAEFGGIQIIVYPMKKAVFEKRFPYREPPRRAEGVMYSVASKSSMGLAPGGLMKQEIYRDNFTIDAWETEPAGRCFVHIVNSQDWKQLTGSAPPMSPPTAKDYSRAGLPWFDYYDEQAAALPGAETLQNLKTVKALGDEKGEQPLPENEGCEPEWVKVLKP